MLASPAAASSTKPPKIVIASPKNGETVNTPTVTVKGSFTVAPFDGPSPRAVATLNGKKLNTSVNGPSVITGPVTWRRLPGSFG